MKQRVKYLKNAKELKQSIKFKNVAITADYSIKKRLVIKVLLRTKIELNKQLRTRMPDANYYLSIKDCKLVMKPTEVMNSRIRLNNQTNNVDEETKAIARIEKSNRNTTQRLELLDRKLESIENDKTALIEMKQTSKKLDQIEAFIFGIHDEKTRLKLDTKNET